MRCFFLEPPSLENHTWVTDYAKFSHVGTWSNEGLCEHCGSVMSRLIPPLQIRWDPGSTTIGDFSYCGYTTIVVPEVRKYLEINKFDFEYCDVQVVPSQFQSQNKPQVGFPYGGPPLSWIRATRRLPLNIEKSNLRIQSECKYCGTIDWGFRRNGLVINGSAWKKEKVFEIQQFVPSGAIVMTESALNVLNKKKFSNVGVHFCGYIDV